MERLDPQKINAHRSSFSRQLLSNIHVFDELDSTNSWLIDYAGCKEVCLAEKQRQGKGRGGHTWSSPDSGNIYLSLSWCFEDVPRYFSLLSLLTGISICESLHTMGLPEPGLKWPNDIYYNEKKLGGILIETMDSGRRVIIGIGINLYRESDSPWSCLTAVMDCVPDRNQLIACILDDLVVKLNTFDQLNFATFKQAWIKWDIVNGKVVRLLHAGGVMHGLARGIDTRGCILVQLENGDVCPFSSAEISLRW